MSASISISQLGWSTPDGHRLLDHLDLVFAPERCGLVGRNGIGKSTLLRLIAGEIAPRAGRIVVDGTIGMMRQIVDVAPDERIADLFGVRDALAILARAEAGRASLDELAEADWTLEARLIEALSAVGLDAGPETPLAMLSGGQRSRAAIAAATFGDPDFLLLDEPTNNLDRAGRDAVIGLLDRWRGGAIVVSHDRELLDHMDAIVELSALGAARHGGGWSAYRDRKAIELAAAERDLASAERQESEVARHIQQAAERKQRRDGAGARKGAKGDQPRILIGARKQRAEESGSAGARLAERQRGAAAEAAEAARGRIEILEPMTVALSPTGLIGDRTVLRLAGVVAGHDRAILDGLDLEIVGPERIAVGGANGAGKSTLLAVIAGGLEPWAGDVKRPLPFALLDQRVSLLDPALSVAANHARRHPDATDNACRAALARFRFRADAADRIVGSLSGGQKLRAGLACVLGGEAPPPLLILDEPTNHLDLDSIAAVEAGLAAYDGALLVVSHDEAFLAAIGIERQLELAGGRLVDGG
ncbi:MULTISPECIES: ABC-F family ATP-binding cassette domain-containing protein [unclassified Sphingomonas]|uniref:ABC-F family ATP-binding cassette domain-containing protein n=1 Tax=unclassified Sphingomonas TaxID=196159 RepID=UPI0006FD3DDE|nr:MULTISPECIES: ABC-F family ATP-binding cassette domain-containing protein [unclassified Sphingomonas]KQX20937.1 ABC transporter [Sphingomonas sp. Root1294]KQY68786.1 ABC transporter [Sphingomonas sp. Root50]KRB88403.1 ABC transporter [Sphingomonas sp. Root720]